jgi:hypothetical protein
MGGWDQNGSYGDWLWGYRMDFVGSGYGLVLGSCEYSDELSGCGAMEVVS